MIRETNSLVASLFLSLLISEAAIANTPFSSLTWSATQFGTGPTIVSAGGIRAYEISADFAFSTYPIILY